jgi:hypothetical protein
MSRIVVYSMSYPYEVPDEDDSAEAFVHDEDGAEPVCGPDDAFDTITDPFVAESGAISLADPGLPAGGSGSASSSSEVVAAPAHLPHEPITYELVLMLANGAKITFYPSGVYECICSNVEGHGRCRKTKSNVRPTGQNVLFRPGLGRPIGFLLAWAVCGCDIVRKDDHRDFFPTWAERKIQRACFKTSGHPLVSAFLRSERPKGDDEDSEPEHM